jgi:hypothetical protein
MLLNGQTTAETYGQLLDWSRHEDAEHLMMIGIGDQPGEGLITLEIQEKILRFLVECAQIIVHDLLSADVTTTTLSQPLPPPPTLNTDTEWSSVAAAIAEAPYKVPVQLDFSRMRSLITAKRAEAEDHIWSLREDPEYFQDAVVAYSEQRGENLPNVNGKRQSPILGTPEFWQGVLEWVVTGAYHNVIMWDVAEKELDKLLRLRERYGSRIEPNRRLPADYEFALLHFRQLIDRMQWAPLMNFQQGISGSPPLRKFYILKDCPDGRTQCQLVPGTKRDDYLLWLLEQLRFEDKVQLYGLSDLLDEFERVTRTTSVAAGTPQIQYVTAWTASLLSSLAVVSELRRSLDLHQPPITRSINDNELDAEFNRRTALLNVFLDATSGSSYVDVGTPLTKFTCPSSKRRTAVSTAKRREAEKNLDIFWLTVDDHYSNKLGNPLHELLSGILSPRELERTPEWVEPLPKPQPRKHVDAITEDFSTFDIEEDRPETPSSIKVKIKTRGTATQTTDEAVMEETPAEHPSPLITVSKRAYKVFSSLFYNPETQDTQPGEVPWTEFLHALSSAGFAVQKQYGSAWLFSPLDGNLRPIIFHEPHPSGKIPFHIARRHGRRLRLTYGWTADTFVTVR